MILADTSIWVDFLRPGSAEVSARLGGLIERGELLMCGPVAAELMGGASRESDRLALRGTLPALPWADLDREAWQAVGDVSLALRESGEVAALVDIAIAVAAGRAGARLWTYDSDFHRIAGVLPELELVELG